MPAIFKFRRLRLPQDLGSFEQFVDQLTGSTPDMWRGNGYRVEVGVFVDLQGSAPESDLAVVDVVGSEYESLTIEVKLTATTVGNLMAKTVSIFDNTLTAETWNDFTKSHAAVEFTAEETNIAAGSYHMVVSVLTTDGEPITLGVSTLRVREDGAHLSVAAAPANPGDAMTLSQADARYVNLIDGLAWGAVSGKPFTAASTGGNGSADAAKAALFRGDGGLKAKSIILETDEGTVLPLVSTDPGTGEMLSALFGAAGTSPGMKMLWNGTLVFPSDTARAGTRTSLSVPALLMYYSSGDPSAPAAGEPTIVINETDDVAQIYADGGWRRIAAWGAAAPFVCIAEGSGADVVSTTGVNAPLTNWVDHYDPSGAHAAGVITVPRTGTYTLIAIANPDDPAGAYYVGLSATINGGTGIPMDQNKQTPLLKGMLDLRLTAGDAIRVVGWQISGSNKNWHSNSSMRLSVKEVPAE